MRVVGRVCCAVITGNRAFAGLGEDLSGAVLVCPSP
jgi:hypothetical protein